VDNPACSRAPRETGAEGLPDPRAETRSARIRPRSGHAGRESVLIGIVAMVLGVWSAIGIVVALAAGAVEDWRRARGAASVAFTCQVVLLFLAVIVLDGWAVGLAAAGAAGAGVLFWVADRDLRR